MTTVPAARTPDVRHLQLARAFFAAVAAVMIAFSPDHSAAVGLAVFSGFAIATGVVWLAAVWLVFPRTRRWPAVLQGVLALLAGMATGMPALRTDTMFVAVVVSWAILSGLVEAVSGWRMRHDAGIPLASGRDALTVGILTIVLGFGLLAVPIQYVLTYTIEEAGQSFTLTGITIAVGIFGGYAAIVAVYLAIAAFSPRPQAATPGAADDAASVASPSASAPLTTPDAETPR